MEKSRRTSNTPTHSSSLQQKSSSGGSNSGSAIIVGSSSGLSKSIQLELSDIARKLCHPGKGILAADESIQTLGKKFQQINLDNTEENRRRYRQMLFSNSKISEYISGVIMFDETLYQRTDQGQLFLDLLRSRNILPGIKVDKGLIILPGTNNLETTTQGLDDLKLRLEKYYKLGCRFTKWRSVLRISSGNGLPSSLAIKENARVLARYASICQENHLVPIVEPEILQDGQHDIEKCRQITEKVWSTTIKMLHDYNVYLEGILLKPNMITSGFDCQKKSNSNQIGLITLQTFLRTIPPAIPGIMFLSGGQSEEEASRNLQLINQYKLQMMKSISSGGVGVQIVPWNLSFSFGRALQTSAINIWMGKDENLQQAQQELLKRMKINSLASLGLYQPTTSSSSADPNQSKIAFQSNFIAKHEY